MSKKVDVIIPVYRGLEETRECIESAIRTLPKELAQLIVINDSSPEPELTQYLRYKAGQNCFELYENEENLGFVATVNKGMSLNPDNDVLLLNSDVEVENNWLERIVAAAYREPKIGSVTPFSNNATICSFPNFCEDNELYGNLNVKELDALCVAANAAGDVVDVPTGVGFCMFIQRECLNEVGLFDVDTFGKGYGEENDWCQRAIKTGWRNVHLMNVFVYHKGGVSFAEEQDPRKDKALEMLNKLHPNYQTDVHSFISRDPAKPFRLKFLLSIIANDDKLKILAIDHGLGGGVAQHIGELAQFVSSKAVMLCLRPCGDNVVKMSFSLETNIKDAIVFDIEKQYDEFLVLCRYLGVGFVHFHHTMGLPTRLWGLARDLDCDYDVTVHDYYHINGNPTLTGSDGVFCGGHGARDELCQTHYSIPVSPVKWRENQRGFLQDAKRVIFPSQDTRDRFLIDFALENDRVAWHPDAEGQKHYPTPVFQYQPGQNRKLRVLVIGAISREKGADVLEQVANRLNGRQVEFHLLGYAYRPLANTVISYGPYLLEDVQTRLNEISPDVVWFPAQWPETYSYTLSIALEYGLPVVVPDIGAFSERIAGRAASVVKPWSITVDEWEAFWSEIIKYGNLEEYSNKQKKVYVERFFYSEEYVNQSWKRESAGDITLELVMRWLQVVNTKKLDRKEVVLQRLWKIREHSIFGKLAALIPFKIQRYIKRKLSSKPIHEVITK